MEIPSHIKLGDIIVRKPFNQNRKMVSFEINNKYGSTILSIEDTEILYKYLKDILNK